MELVTAWEMMAVELEHAEETRQRGLSRKLLGPSIPHR